MLHIYSQSHKYAYSQSPQLVCVIFQESDSENVKKMTEDTGEALLYSDAVLFWSPSKKHTRKIVSSNHIV